MFQSAPACERATRARMRATSRSTAFQSAPACERATRSSRRNAATQPFDGVSIRARVRAGDLTKTRGRGCWLEPFQSAPACERATRVPRSGGHLLSARVSIRARVRAGDIEAFKLQQSLRLGCFNPRPRASGRPALLRDVAGLPGRFQSAPACERASFLILSRRFKLQQSAMVFRSAPACERATPPPPTMRIRLHPHRRICFNPAPACERATKAVHNTFNFFFFVAGKMFQSAPACERATSPTRYH